MFETIVALATPPLKSALSIVRLSGDDCFEIVSRFFSKDLNNFASNQIMHGFIVDEKEIIDEVVLLAYKGPKSFTGEDSVEIISHGSPLIFNRIIEVAIKNNARMANGGEFSSRAFMHGKLDLLQAESINDLINAESEESKKISLMALQGNASKLIEPIKKDLGDLLSLIEVNIDYPEYTDIEEANYQKIIEVSQKNISYIDSLIKDGYKGKIIKEGIKVAIVGKPNVGKSSLLNALIEENKAIVTDIKGTTRDIVEGKFLLNGILINLLDTAGIRESLDLVEGIGINKSLAAIDDADLIIALFDDLVFDEEDQRILKLIENKKHIIVYNKKDLLNKPTKDLLTISALNNDIEPLKVKILQELGIRKENFDNPSIANFRGLGLLEKVREDLKKIISDSKNELSLDLVNVTIKDAYLSILSMIGEDHDFDIAKEIFSRFCLGK
ncbi:MAG TPA: tRNA uridine-5-carboxymethylaminomethyl(34) synthesis GTPase MnmE [Candidatus Onthovivens sp.]|nr:tRNA uridine-5-carboxymethylaminomethyl(34) synthesis GTPase MnmE [Candidatus Onthovivens sp.]